ncbi:MAG: hypothetical protein PF495_09400 [Spirochaetales bacterium]|nr:hypothetical protein [Spirochaetales bacterium]
MKKKIIAAVALSASLTLPTAVMAKLVGHCGNCHTMHNSQDGSSEAVTYNQTTPGLDPTDTPNSTLLKSGCVGCHTGVNDGGAKPFILSIGDPTGVELAGGNFFWAISDASKGHNVVGITGIDTAFTVIPGSLTAYSSTTQVTCAGTMGCHGIDNGTDNFTSIKGGHHGGAADPINLAAGNGTYVSGDTDDMANSYRMLNGIEGIEDDDWEFDTTGHNVYSGADRSLDSENNTKTISSLCARCHGDFHNTNSAGADVDIISANNMNSPWVRHPTDFDMGNLATTSEYKVYAYSLEAPVASDNVGGITSITDYDTSVTAGLTGNANGAAIVTCISCHRAHGSPNADLLRWKYNTTDAMATGTGCFICHTTKD